jgi:hypothetical protein
VSERPVRTTFNMVPCLHGVTAEHSAHAIDRVLRAEFAHDIFAVSLYGARADGQRACLLEAPLTI